MAEPPESVDLSQPFVDAADRKCRAESRGGCLTARSKRWKVPWGWTWRCSAKTKAAAFFFSSSPALLLSPRVAGDQ